MDEIPAELKARIALMAWHIQQERRALNEQVAHIAVTRRFLDEGEAHLTELEMQLRLGPPKVPEWYREAGLLCPVAGRR